MKEIISGRFFPLLLKLFILALGSAVAIKYLLPSLLPFILAYLTAELSRPTVQLLSRKLKLTYGFSSFLCTAVFLLSILGILFFTATKLYDWAAGMVSSLPGSVSQIQSTLSRLYSSVEIYVSRMPEGVQSYVDSFIKGLESFPEKLSSALISAITGIMDKAASFFLFLIVYIIASFFISPSLTEIKRFISRQIPPRLRQLLFSLKKDIVSGIGIWLRAQLMMMGITFLELTVIFLIMGLSNPVIAAAAVAAIDALPVLGTGTVLIPWAVLSFILGNTPRAIFLLCSYFLVTTLRNVLEPHIVSSGFGVNPVVSLLFAYMGYRLTGPAGMIALPLAVMILKSLNDKGYVKLWR